jgi:flavin reductase (DIM6/NTAB) family NADH-FMN oxidoreductase RutF
MKKRLGPSDRLYPMPCPIVVGGSMEEADGCAVAWIGICGGKPPSVALALRKTRRTLELIRTNGTFTVNTPHADDAAVVDYFGIVGGRDHDKFAETGWTLEPSSEIPAPGIAECPYVLECRLVHELDVGEHILLVGVVVDSHADEDVLDETGTKVDVAKLDPLVYIAGSRDYRRIGEKVADAFSIGKTVAPE